MLLFYFFFFFFSTFSFTTSPSQYLSSYYFCTFVHMHGALYFAMIIYLKFNSRICNTDEEKFTSIFLSHHNRIYLVYWVHTRTFSSKIRIYQFSNHNIIWKVGGWLYTLYVWISYSIEKEETWVREVWKCLSAIIKFIFLAMFFLIFYYYFHAHDKCKKIIFS